MKKIILVLAVLGSSASVIAQPDSMAKMASMNGKCEENSQFTRMTAAEYAQKTRKYNPYQCNAALMTEFTNGRVVVNFNKKGVDTSLVGFSGYFSGKDKETRLLEVDAMYFGSPEFARQKLPASGRCEVEYKAGKVSSLACLSGTKLKDGNIIISSAIFTPSSYSIENIPLAGSESASPSPSSRPATPMPSKEPWYGVASGGGKCLPTDMSPAERIEWLRERGVRYDALDSFGTLPNGRVSKVTTIPRGGNYPNWVYYGNKAICEEKETAIEKYR